MKDIYKFIIYFVPEFFYWFRIMFIYPGNIEGKFDVLILWLYFVRDKRPWRVAVDEN